MFKPVPCVELLLIQSLYFRIFQCRLNSKFIELFLKILSIGVELVQHCFWTGGPGTRLRIFPSLNCSGAPSFSEAAALFVFAAPKEKGGKRSLSTFDRPFFSVPIKADATPAPQLRRGNQSAFHGIIVDVIEFLYILSLRSDVEIVRPGLPKRRRQITGKQAELKFHPALLVAAPGGNALLQHPHYEGRVLDLRFAHQQVEVFGHHNVTCYHELILLSGLFQHFQEKVTPRGRVEKWQPVITRTSHPITRKTRVPGAPGVMKCQSPCP
jgi:hypothetical protein